MLTSGMRSDWVYILASRPRGTLYVGVTGNLIRRIYQHREGVIEGFTKEHALKMLVFYEQHATAMAAIQREKKNQTPAAPMEDRPDLLDERRMARPLAGYCALTVRLSFASSHHGPPGQARW
jgi:putative endonuclease